MQAFPEGWHRKKFNSSHAPPIGDQFKPTERFSAPTTFYLDGTIEDLSNFTPRSVFQDRTVIVGRTETCRPHLWAPARANSGPPSIQLLIVSERGLLDEDGQITGTR